MREHVQGPALPKAPPSHNHTKQDAWMLYSSLTKLIGNLESLHDLLLTLFFKCFNGPLMHMDLIVIAASNIVGSSVTPLDLPTLHAG